MDILAKNIILFADLPAKCLLEDYQQGIQEGRYLAQQLPQTSFTNNTYDIALCSHFLFLYSAHCSYDFHLAAITEMLRISREVRIFPLMTLMQEISPYLDSVIKHFQHLDYSTLIVNVPYEFQPGANKMLVIKR